MAATLSALSAAAAQRGQSAVEAVQRHAEGLQAALDAHTQALTQQQNKFARLREDFNYNLQLLRQRDVALQEAAEANRAAAEALEERERLLSEVSARLDEASQRERVQREGREEDARRHAEALQRLKVCRRGRGMNAQEGTKQTHWPHKETAQLRSPYRYIIADAALCGRSDSKSFILLPLPDRLLPLSSTIITQLLACPLG